MQVGDRRKGMWNLYPGSGKGEKSRCDSRPQRLCGEQTVKRACLESLLASGTRVAMAAMACIQGGHLWSPCQAVLTDRLWEPRCLRPTGIEAPGPVLGWNGQREKWPGVIWQVESWHSEEALGELANTIG